MSSRSFRVFGTRKDLENIFKEFQNSNTIKYYKFGMIMRIVKKYIMI